MSKEVAFLWVAEVIMILAGLCFLRAFQLRKTDNQKHQELGRLGAYTVFAALILLEVLMRGLGWRFPVRSETVLQIHITVASVALAALIALLFTGVTRRRSIHVRLYLVFVPSYLAAIVLSLFAFRLW